MSDRPFKVLGIEQIAIGGLDLKALRSLWIDTLGLTAAGSFRNEGENVTGEIAMAGSGPFRVSMNLLQPIDPEKSPRAHKPPLNHIGLWVDDLNAAVDWLTARGMRFTPRGIRKGAAGCDITFIHPSAGGEGVLIELVQAPPDLIELERRMSAESTSAAEA
ncbi:MAG: VOC family protein [Anaerolineae bacterium]|nr:VOC family protein [Gemmatimonadaceae bacterium]